MNNKNFLKGLIIVLLLLLILFSIEQKRHPHSEVVRDTIKIIKTRDSLIPYKVFVPKDSIVINTIFVKDTITKYDTLVRIDTLLRIDTVIKIVREYLTVYVYKDTILNNDRGLIVVTDSLYKNRIKHRETEISLFNNQPNYFILAPYLRNDEALHIGLNLFYERLNSFYGVGIEQKGFTVTYGYRFNPKTIMIFKKRKNGK